MHNSVALIHEDATQLWMGCGVQDATLAEAVLKAGTRGGDCNFVLSHAGTTLTTPAMLDLGMKVHALLSTRNDIVQMKCGGPTLPRTSRRHWLAQARRTRWARAAAAATTATRPPGRPPCSSRTWRSTPSGSTTRCR